MKRTIIFLFLFFFTINFYSQEYSLDKVFEMKTNIEIGLVDKDLVSFWFDYVVNKNKEFSLNDISFVNIGDSLIIGKVPYYIYMPHKEPYYYIYDMNKKEIHVLFEYWGGSYDYIDPKRISQVKAYNMIGQKVMDLTNVFFDFKRYLFQFYDYQNNICNHYTTIFHPEILIDPSKANIKRIRVDKCLADRTLYEYFEFIKDLKEESYLKDYEVLEPENFPRRLEKIK